MPWGAPPVGAAAASQAPSQEAPADPSAAAPAPAAVSATASGVLTSSCNSPLQQRNKRALFTGGTPSRYSCSHKGAPISAEALRRFFGVKGSSTSFEAQKRERDESSAPSAPTESSNYSRIFPASCAAAGAPASVAASSAAYTPAEEAASDSSRRLASSAANVSEPGPATALLKPGDAASTGAVCWRLKRYLKPCSAVNFCNKQRCTGSGVSAPLAFPHGAAIAAAESSSSSTSLSRAECSRMGMKGISAAATLQETGVVSKRAAVRAPESAPVAAAGNASRAGCTPEDLGRGNGGRKNAPAVAASDAASATATPSAGFSDSTAVVCHSRPWADLPDPLVLQVLDFGGREIAMTCRRFAGLIRRQRRVLRFSGDASTTSSAEALIRAIMSSPGLRLLEITAGGGLSASQMDRLSRARSSSLPQKLQVLVMRRCNRLTDKSLRTLLLRLRELRCVDLRDSFSLTDEALSTLGFLPRLERVALGLTAGARGCCRLTCRSLKALLTPQRQEQPQQKQQQQQDSQQPQGQAQAHRPHPEQAQEGCISPIKFLSLARCSEMKDFTVLVNAKATLEFLDLRGTAIDDTSAHVFAQLHNLQVLVLADTAVTTATVSAVVDGCPKLQMLDLSCTGDTADLADAVAEHASATGAAAGDFFPWKQLKRLGLFGCNVERQKVEAALILAGATNARLSLHNEMALFEMPRVYATMKGLDI
ncbi:hypothetical protein, conserved [Eimeria acervulina]|uniref:Leucine rich repeat protein n=1 Tax=Eimeria acervulina TaxID=5801 RepID=U6GH60_EIMAC|nr:hypothetical protein, conserved [Eimeria acervulina]CDI77939.1 hypothetical protein, conserved [Eimeria acervulina]